MEKFDAKKIRQISLKRITVTSSICLLLNLAAIISFARPGYSVGGQHGASLSADPGLMVRLSGNVFYDGNQLTDNLVNNNPESVVNSFAKTSVYQTIPSGIYAVLYNPATNTVVATQPIAGTVSPNGSSFSFDVMRNTDYQVMLSTVAPAVGQPIPSPSLPLAPAYFFTGETQAGGGNNVGVVDGRSPVIHIGSIDVVHVDFGIKAPTGGGGE